VKGVANGELVVVVVTVPLPEEGALEEVDSENPILLIGNSHSQITSITTIIIIIIIIMNMNSSGVVITAAAAAVVIIIHHSS
jgi:hypothetical protein